MMAGNGQFSVPPGFRFHPTDEELLYYYLRKKVSYEAIDLDVIREVDLNKLEPWDLKEKCRIGSGPQNEWYFFSHKDKKYPTGTRTNRATSAGFWKATGRDKTIHLGNCKRIGMRKTLVFYTGRAPHGQKTEWIMHEYRLDEESLDVHLQEDGWVVCRVFRKKNHSRGYQQQQQQQPEVVVGEEEQFEDYNLPPSLEPKIQNIIQAEQYDIHDYCNFDGSMHLPQLLNPPDQQQPASAVNHPSTTILSPFSFNNMDIECSQNLLRLTSNVCGSGGGGGLIHHQQQQQQERFNGTTDWSFLDRLLTNSQFQTSLDQCSSSKCHHHHSSQAADPAPSTQRFPIQYFGSETNIFKFTKHPHQI